VDITKAGLFIVGFLPTIQASKRELKNTIFHYCILLDAVGNLNKKYQCLTKKPN
jgi:hypothetical protein